MRIASGGSRTMLAKASSKSSGSRTPSGCTRAPIVRAASAAAWYRSVMPRSFTFQSIATVRNEGTMSLSSSRRLGASSMAISETPVTLPPRQTFDQTRCNGIASRFGYHDWNGCRRILGGDGCRTAKGQDHVYVARHEILGKLRQLFPVVPAGTHFERHIAIGRVAVTH